MMSDSVLCLDVGNTNLKWSRCRLRDMHMEISGCVDNVQSITLDSIEAEFGQLEMIPVWISHVSTSGVRQLLIRWFKDRWDVNPRFIEAVAEYDGLKNSYMSPDDLGVDRWLAMLSVKEITKNDFCVIDAGTAVTIDVVDKKGVHQGGVIMPGKGLMLQALVSNTSNIKQPKGELAILADNTADAVMTGVIASLIGGVDRVLEDVGKRYPEIEVFLTGGDAELFKHNNWIAVTDLVLRGVGLVAQNEYA